MRKLKSLPVQSAYHFLIFSPFSSSSSAVAKTPNPGFVNYLVKTFNFSKTHSLSIATRYSHLKSLEKPQSVVQYLHNLGFSDTHIQASVRGSPQILLANINKTLQPKIEFFQRLGLKGHDLGMFVSQTSTLLTVSFERKLVPCVKLLKKVLLNDENNEDLFKVLRRCNWVMRVNTYSRLLPNIEFLRSCGIVGSQLAFLLRRQPRLFVYQESALRDIVSKVSDMGFPMNSRMFVYALYSVSCLSVETFERKFETFKHFGFSKDEYMEMVRKAPVLLKNSEKKSRLGIDFFLNTVKLKKEVLLHRPRVLLSSIEARVIPRYRVLEILKSKKLLKKEPSFLNVLDLTEDEFLGKYISRFEGHKEELLTAYKGHILYVF